MTTLTTIEQLRGWREALAPSARLGFVPTMGALHEGHLSLVRRATEECEVVIASIFVNPAQFNDPKDCETYPRNYQRDTELMAESGAQAVFLPDAGMMYADGYRFRVVEIEASREREGAFRPGHFDGVLTVVMKLLNLVEADAAYFGEKDWQQLELVTGMVQAFFVRTRIVPCPTVREPDGLAMSSRNVRLSGEARNKAGEFPRVLQESETDEAARAELQSLGFEVEYVVDQAGRRFGAVVLEGVRLIDNWDLRDTAAKRLKEKVLS